MLVAEFARTRSEVNTSSLNQVATQGLKDVSGKVEGDAWRVEFATTATSSMPPFRRAHRSGVQQPASPLYGGRGEYNARLARGPAAGLYVEACAAKTAIPMAASAMPAAPACASAPPSALTLDVGLRSIRETIGVIRRGRGAPSARPAA
jgi:hypothetical protein